MAYPTALDLDLANTALARISERGIVSFTENSAVARQVSRLYPRVRNLMFGAMDWRFATARALLGTDLGSYYPYAHSFQLPPNVSRARMVVPGNPGSGSAGGDPMPFEEGVAYLLDGVTEVRVIRCDHPTPVLVYTQLIENPALWDDGFTSAFTVQLAAELALGVTGNGQIATSMREAAMQAIASQQPVGQAQSITPQSRGPSTTTAARDA